METQNSNPAPSATEAVDTTITTDEAATNNGGNATQEVSSTTPAPVEVTKRSLRVDTWRKMQTLKLGSRYRIVFNTIPRFVDSGKALELLVETEEFQKANEIKIQIDRALNGAKIQTVLADKNLYLPSTRNSQALYLKVDVPEESNEKEKIELLNAQNIEKHRTEIGPDNKVVLDMVIVGAVLVSRDGRCIGRGNGYNDLDIALLTEVGSITPNTIIATLVHDVQVVDELPTDLFQKYDAPVDLIITPNEVIRVEKRLPRPTGVFWELLSERRLKVVGALQALKERLETEGKVITLKDEDTDVEQFHQKSRNRRRAMPNRRRMAGRRFQNRTTSQSNNDQQGDSNEQPQKRNVSRRRRFTNRRRRTTKSEGDQSGVESKSQDRKPANAGKRRQRMPERTPHNRDFSIKLTNISRQLRIKDLKSELRNRQCNPLGITWKGNHGHCVLHFGKRNGEPSTEEEMNQVLESLSNLTLTIAPEDENNDAKAAEDADGVKNVEGAEGEKNVEGVVVGANGEKGVEGAEDAAVNGGENAGDQKTATEATKTPIVITLKAELIKFADRANNKAKSQASATSDAPAATVLNGGDPAAGGDASSARIESVDTTTV